MSALLAAASARLTAASIRCASAGSSFAVQPARPAVRAKATRIPFFDIVSSSFFRRLVVYAAPQLSFFTKAAAPQVSIRKAISSSADGLHPELLRHEAASTRWVAHGV